MSSDLTSKPFVKQLTFARQANRDLTYTSLSHYAIFQPFKYGPNSTVYRGVDKVNSRRVALKIVDFDRIQEDRFPSGKEQLRTILKSQAYLMNQFNSPHLLKCYQVFENDSMLVLVLDYCNLSLADVLDEIEFSQNEANSIIKRSLRGLKILHEKDILHLNLKPENILIKNGQPVIADFGFHMSSLQKNESFKSPQAIEFYVKTSSFPLTMNPRIFKGHNLNKDADYWSLESINHRLRFPFYPIPDYQYPCYFYLLDEVRSNQKDIEKFKSCHKYCFQVRGYVEQWINRDTTTKMNDGLIFKYYIFFQKELVQLCQPQILKDKQCSISELMKTINREEFRVYQVESEVLIKILKVSHCVNNILKVVKNYNVYERQVCQMEILLTKFCSSVIDQIEVKIANLKEEGENLFLNLKEDVLKLEQYFERKKKKIDCNFSAALEQIGGKFISLFTSNSLKSKRDSFLTIDKKDFNQIQFIDFLPQYYNELVKGYLTNLPLTTQKELQRFANIQKLQLFSLLNTSFAKEAERLLNM